MPSITWSLPIEQVNDVVTLFRDFACARVPSTEKPLPGWVLRVAPIAHAALQQLLPRNALEAKAKFTLKHVALSIYASYHTEASMEEAVRLMPQRSPMWYKIRNGWCDVENDIFRAPLISSSLCGMILQHKDDYKTNHIKLLKEQVWFDCKEDPSVPMDAFGIRALQRGTAMEPSIMEYTKCIVQRECQLAMPKCSVEIQEVGLHICLSDPWMAASPDGIVTCYDPDTSILYRTGLEMKCRAIRPSVPYPVIKPEYYDQCQHTMALLGFEEYIFVCHGSESFGFETYTFDKKAWERHYEALKAYYWKKLWPRVVLRALGFLDDNTIDEVSSVSVDEVAEQQKFIPASRRRIHPTLEQLVGDCPVRDMDEVKRARWMSALRNACASPAAADNNRNKKRQSPTTTAQLELLNAVH